MIRAIVFDLGGVLFSEGKSVAVERLAKERGYRKEIVLRMLTSPESVELRKGLITDEAFWRWAQHELPAGYDAQLVRQAWYDGYILDEDILKLIKRLKGKYAIIAFSGNVRSRVDFLEEKYRFRHLFDKEIYSFDYHLTKPDKNFIDVLLTKSGCRPEEIAYIEDNDSYAQTAREAGINVPIYRRGSIRDLEDDLRRLGVNLEPEPSGA